MKLANMIADFSDWRGPTWKTCVFHVDKFLVDVDLDTISCVRYLFLEDDG